jgi:ribosomal protein S18 acetylase RimI-like enzyme
MTAAMVPEVARIHSETFAGYLSARLGRAYVKAYIRWFCQARQAIALVATDGDHKIIGYVVGAPLGYNQAMNRSLFLVAATSIMLRPWLFFSAPFRRAIVARLWLMLGLPSPQPAEISLPPPAMSLVTIGVSSGARGKNVGRSLTEAFEAKARARQMRSLRLSVLPDNISARRLYEKCGWQPLATPVRDHEAMYYFRVLTN